MIDDPATAARLLDQLQEQLPILAMPSREFVRTLRQQGLRARPNHPLQIREVFYMGDEGGICCDVTPEACWPQGETRHAVVSLTHLEVDPAHPLAAEIRGYQHRRTLNVALRRL